MGIFYATVVEGSAGRPFGIVAIDGHDISLRTQTQDNARLARYVNPPHALCLVPIPHHSLPLNAGDQLVVLMIKTKKSERKIELWASRREWDVAMGFEPQGPVSPQASDSTPAIIVGPEASISPALVPRPEPEPPVAVVVGTSEVATVPVIQQRPAPPKVEETVTFGDIAKKVGEPFASALASVFKAGQLTMVQLRDFAEHLPKGKRGDALMVEYESRKKKSRDSKHYTPATFVKEVLEPIGLMA